MLCDEYSHRHPTSHLSTTAPSLAAQAAYFEGRNDRLLMTLNRIEHFGNQCQTRHVLQGEVFDIGIRHRQEFPKQCHALLEQFLIQIHVQTQSNRFEKNRMLGVALVGVLHRAHSVDGLGQDIGQTRDGGRIFRGRKVLKQSERLHLEPRRRNAIVRVLLCHILVDH